MPTATISDPENFLWGMSAVALLRWANDVRVWAAAIAAVAALVTFLASWAQIRLQSVVSADKDRAFEEFRVTSMERTAVAQADAAGAQEKAGRANERAAALEEAAAQLRAQNLSVSLELERERTARIQLEGKLASRHVTKEQSDALVAALKDHPNLPVSLTRLGDREAHDYATELLAALKSAKAFVSVRDAGSMSPPVYGLQVSPRNGPMADAFRASQISHTTVGGTGVVISIVVGLKPPNF